MTDTVMRCKKCIIPATYPGVHFNEQDICSFCLHPIEEKPFTEKDLKIKLDKIIKTHQGKGKYDVIVGLSGGKDSSYVAYYLKKEYDLKILGVNFDNGYRSEYATHNIVSLIDKLEIDFLTIRPSQVFIKKLFAHFLQKQGEFCSVCNNMGYLLIASFAWNQKKTSGVSPLVVGGWSKKYEYQPGISVTSMQYFFNNLTSKLMEELITQPLIEEKVVRSYMHLNDPRQVTMGTKEAEEFENYIMNMIQLPDYIPWDLKKMPTILMENVGWKQPLNSHSSHFDCTIFPVKEFLKFKKYGLTQETIKNSVMIREGLITREEALAMMSFEQTTEPDILRIFLGDVGLSIHDINMRAEWSR